MPHLNGYSAKRIDIDSPRYRRLILAINSMTLASGGIPPGVREIAREINVPRGSLTYMLAGLKEREIVTWEPTLARTLKLTAKGQEILARFKREG